MRLRMLLASLGVLSLVFTAAASPAAAGKHGNSKQGKTNQRTFKCDGTFSGKTVKNVVVQRGDSCTLMHSSVKGKVRVLKGAYFQATDTSIRRDVRGDKAQTLFIDTGTTVGGSIRATRTIQVFVFNATVGGAVSVKRATDKVQICGTTLMRGSISVSRSGTDILIGDPLALDCGGNAVKRGGISVTRSFTDVELVIRSNAIPRGDLRVTGNTGSSAKYVQDNSGGRTLTCTGNDPLFTASGNATWQQQGGQCP
jgi:hypothetical protein